MSSQMFVPASAPDARIFFHPEGNTVFVAIEADSLESAREAIKHVRVNRPPRVLIAFTAVRQCPRTGRYRSAGWVDPRPCGPPPPIDWKECA